MLITLEPFFSLLRSIAILKSSSAVKHTLLIKTMSASDQSKLRISALYTSIGEYGNSTYLHLSCVLSAVSYAKSASYSKSSIPLHTYS